MPDIVNEFQTFSVPGRSIHQNLSIIRDVVEFSNCRGGPCAIISIDQHKAFDKVCLDFLFKVLRRIRFGPYFRSWVNILYSNITSRISVNGQLSDDVIILRGCVRAVLCRLLYMFCLRSHLLSIFSSVII